VWRGESAAAQRGWQSEPAAREECVQAVAACFAATHARSGPSSGALLVFNLFALEGWHLAERLGVPAVAAAPYVVPYTLPAAFSVAFERALPQLAAALRAAQGDTVSMREFEHWMWPLWTVRSLSMHRGLCRTPLTTCAAARHQERWGDWRVDRLGLPSLPFMPPGSDDGDDDSDGRCAPLPRATPLLYGFSDAISERPGYWPASVAVTGCWHAPPGWEGGDGAGGEYTPPAALSAFVEQNDGARRLAAVTLGSMASLDGAVAHPRMLLSALAVRACMARHVTECIRGSRAKSRMCRRHAGGAVGCGPARRAAHGRRLRARSRMARRSLGASRVWHQRHTRTHVKTRQLTVHAHARTGARAMRATAPLGRTCWA
jgi:hypothetical protein